MRGLVPIDATANSRVISSPKGTRRYGKTIKISIVDVATPTDNHMQINLTARVPVKIRRTRTENVFKRVAYFSRQKI